MVTMSSSVPHLASGPVERTSRIPSVQIRLKGLCQRMGSALIHPPLTNSRMLVGQRSVSTLNCAAAPRTSFDARAPWRRERETPQGLSQDFKASLNKMQSRPTTNAPFVVLAIRISLSNAGAGPPGRRTAPSYQPQVPSWHERTCSFAKMSGWVGLPVAMPTRMATVPALRLLPSAGSMM